MVETDYEERRKKEKQIAKQLALNDIKEWKNKIPKEKHKTPAIVVGTKTFTPEEIEKEVEKDTEYGQQFTKILARAKLEMTKGAKDQ